MKNRNMFIGIGFAIFGLLVLIFPAFWFKVIVVLLGLGAVVYGIYCVKFIKPIFQNSAYELSVLIKSVANILVGVSAVIFPLAIGKTVWSIMVWILIVDLIVSAILGFYAAALLKDSGSSRKKYFMENVGLLAVAVFLIILSPQSLANVVLRIGGIVALIAGLIIVLIEVISQKNTVSVKFESAEVKDVPEQKDDSEN